MANGGTTPATSPAAERPKGHRSWRPAALQPGARHQWQQRGQQPGAALFAGRGARRFRVALFFGSAGVLLALLVWYLLYAPVQTPLIAIAATTYEWPLAPNAWAAEDLRGLGDLDRKTLRLADLSADWRSAERGLARLDDALKKLAREQGRSHVAILYVSMHGAVDASGRACLVPPGAAAQDSSTWLPLATFLDRVNRAKLPASMHKLLVLDCTRQPVDWNIGQIAGGFDDALPKAIEEAHVPHLAILSATSDGESAAASPSLRGSVFGHYLRLGLAGAADDRQASGNGNGRVTLQELKDYLTSHVFAWVAHHQGKPQTPEVFPKNADFDVAWSLRSGQWREMAARAQRIESADPSVAAGRLASLWRKLDELRAARPWRCDPITWRDLEQRLLWLDQLAKAGKAYDERASALAAQLTNDLGEAEQRHVVARQGRSLPAYVGLLTGNDRLPAVKTHSLSLAQFWGSVDADTLRTVAGQLQRCGKEPSRDNLAAALTSFEASASIPATDEANFLSIWQRQFVPSLWPNSTPLSQTLEARQLAEQKAVPPSDGELPGDERAHAFVRPQLAPLDQARRKLEDALAIGPQAAGAPPAGSEVIAGLNNLTLGERAAKTFALRDELWAELPYLAQWLCRPQSDAQQQEQADAAIRQTLLPLIAAGLDLEQRLARDNSTNGNATWSADSAAALVQAKFDELRAMLQAAIDATSKSAERPELASDIDALLALPILPWDVREQLARQRLELHLKLSARYDGPFDGAAAIVTPSAAAMPHASRVLRWPAHPLALLLDGKLAAKPAANGGSPLADEPVLACAKLGDEIRRRLTALAGSAESTGRSKSLSTSAASRTSAAEIAGLCVAESHMRRAAGLWFPRPGIDPVRELRRSELQDFLLWRAQRALDDFQGPPRAGREPLFAISAADYLAAARSLGPLSESAAAKANELDGLLARRRIAAREALAVSATDILLVDQAASVSSEIAVSSRTPEALADLPAATAAVFLADDSGRIGRQCWPLEVPSRDSRAGNVLLSQQSMLETAGLKTRGPLLQAVASVRGNDFAAPVVLRAPGGALVEFQQPLYGPPSVTVLGHERKRASVVFILDCSHSMQELTSVEGPDAASRAQSTRMDVARRALNMLLADLAQRGSLRVGVRLFGHRVGWSTTEANKLLRQTAYGEEIPAELRPYADVEEILPLGRFDSIAAGKVLDKLQTVRAWGESPIYLALQQAVGDFGADDNSARSIVLITDGQNYQFNPPRESQPALADVLSAAERAQIAINIVGFEMPQDEARAAAREFNEIASRTGGSYVPAAGATTLLDSLQRLLRPGEFRVTDAAGSVVGEAELGHAVSLPAQHGRRPYQVTFEHLREPIELFGGEAVELAIRRGEPRLEVVPYLKGSPRFEPLVLEDNGDSTALQAGIHRSVRTPEGVQFPISIQPADGHFVPRPVEMWVEIAPVGLPPEQSPGPFIFYDAPLAPATSVPLANFLARQWPAQVAKAEVRIWAKNSASPIAEERPLSEVADRLPDGGVGFPVAGISGVAYQVRTSGAGGEPLVVGLIERHERADSVGTLKVTLAPQPRRALHQFDPHNKIVLHTFFYDPAADRGRLVIQFTTRDAALAHSVRMAQPAVIDVSDRSDLLELTPAIK